MKKLLSRRVLFIISIVTIIIFSALLFHLQLLPLKYYVPLVIILMVVSVCLYRFEKDKHHEKQVKVAICKLIQILLSCVLLLTSFYMMKGSRFLSSITGGKDQVIEMDVIVLKTSGYKQIADLKGLAFGANTSLDSINVNKAETIIEEDIGSIDVTAYLTNEEMIQAFQTQSVKALIVKAIDLDSFDEIEKDFTDRIEVIKTIEIKIPAIEANSAKVTQEPFHVFISGTDKEGDINTFALSDVNMLATINPQTKQVLLTNIPRDYFVDIVGMTNANGKAIQGKDKLTHSAKGGVSCTISTVENLLGIECNYYAKFNFTSFINIVDALGGIEIDVPQYQVIGRNDGVFTTKKGNYTIHPGKNQKFDAKKALCFVRERKAFVEGDTIRGKNQMLVMKAIIKKCCTPSILTKLDNVFESLSDCFETNMSAKDVKSLINMQVDDGMLWDIQSYRMIGDSSQRTTSLLTVGDVTSVNPKGVFITYPDENSVAEVKSYIQTIMSNEILKLDKEETSDNE